MMSRAVLLVAACVAALAVPARATTCPAQGQASNSTCYLGTVLARPPTVSGAPEAREARGVPQLAALAAERTRPSRAPRALAAPACAEHLQNDL